MTDPKDDRAGQRPDEVEGDHLDEVAGGVDRNDFPAGNPDVTSPDAHHGSMPAPE